MGGIKTLIFLQLIYITTCMEQLDIIYEWTQLDFQFPTPEARQQAIDSRSFIPENNIPMGLEIFGDRLFVTVPRWRTGVPASLNYVNLKGNFDFLVMIFFTIIYFSCVPFLSECRVSTLNIFKVFPHLGFKKKRNTCL